MLDVLDMSKYNDTKNLFHSISSSLAISVYSYSGMLRNSVLQRIMTHSTLAAIDKYWIKLGFGYHDFQIILVREIFPLYN